MSQLFMNNNIARLARPLIAAGILLLAARGASATDLTEGQQYKLLAPSQPTDVAPGKVEVVEFFFYACPHCYALQPKLESWVKKGKPAYVQFVAVPATWNEMLKTHARMYYTAEMLGKLPQLNDEFYREMHVRGNRLDTPEKIEAFFVAHGVSKADFQKTFASFAVESRLRQAEDLARRYKITSTPTLAVGGKYVTDVAMAGSEDALFPVLNALAAKSRPGH